jgi:hypothetical protein
MAEPSVSKMEEFDYELYRRCSDNNMPIITPIDPVPIPGRALAHEVDEIMKIN